MKNKRQESGDPSSDSYLGPWAPPKEEEEQQQQPRQLVRCLCVCLLASSLLTGAVADT